MTTPTFRVLVRTKADVLCEVDIDPPPPLMALLDLICHPATQTAEDNIVLRGIATYVWHVYGKHASATDDDTGLDEYCVDAIAEEEPAAARVVVERALDGSNTAGYSLRRRLVTCGNAWMTRWAHMRRRRL